MAAMGREGAHPAQCTASRGGCAASVRAPPRRPLTCSRRAHDPARPCRRSSGLYVTGKAAPSMPEVHVWAMLVLLGPGQVQLGPGLGRGGLSRVRTWASDVLQQRERHEQVLGPPPPVLTSPPRQPSLPVPTPTLAGRSIAAAIAASGRTSTAGARAATATIAAAATDLSAAC